MTARARALPGHGGSGGTARRSLTLLVIVTAVVGGSAGAAQAAVSRAHAATIAVYRPSTGTWYVQGTRAAGFGVPGDVPVPADYNGDGRTDLAVWRPSTHTWYVRGRSAVRFGRAGDVPVPGDYNGDGRAELTLYRPANATWYVWGRPGVRFGRAGDTAVPGDYNNDGRTELAVWRPSTHTWYVRGRAGVVLGRTGDVPVPGNYRGLPAPQTEGQRIAAYAKTFVGKYRYREGGSSPATGFDCSGLTSYVYRHFGRTIARTADAQYRQFRRIAAGAARPGDLVFFHGGGTVFHVGVYEGAHMMVAAATARDGIRYQSIWSSSVTYGTVTH